MKHLLIALCAMFLVVIGGTKCEARELKLGGENVFIQPVRNTWARITPRIDLPVPSVPPVSVQGERRLVVARGTRDYQGSKTTSSAGIEVIGYSKESCVNYAKRKAGISRPLGYAGKTRVQGTTPQAGAIGLMKRYGHAVFIEAVNGNTLQVSEANWIKGKLIRRTLDISQFRGFIYR